MRILFWGVFAIRACKQGVAWTGLLTNENLDLSGFKGQYSGYPYVKALTEPFATCFNFTSYKWRYDSTKTIHENN